MVKAFESAGVDYKYYSERQISLDEKLAWDHINILVSKNFLKSEYNNAMSEKVTPNCRQKCTGCGASCVGTGVCFERGESK